MASGRTETRAYNKPEAYCSRSGNIELAQTDPTTRRVSEEGRREKKAARRKLAVEALRR